MNAGNFANNANGTTTPHSVQQRLPLEIWEYVLNQLINPTDRFQASQAFSTWNTLLHGKKLEFIFPQVLPHLMNYLNGNELLKCRGVCSTWKNSVDYLLQHGPHLRPLRNLQQQRQTQELVPLAHVNPEHYIFTQTAIKFAKVQDIQRFMQVMLDGEVNPFPGRSVRFSHLTARVQAHDLLDYEEQLRQFLGRYGRHIWRFQYKLPIHESPNNGRNMMIRLLECLPQVKTLHFEDGHHWLSQRIMGGRQLQLLGEEQEEEEMAVVVEENPLPFPALPHLIEITIPNHSLFHGDYLDSLVEAYNTQVVSVQWINQPFLGHRITSMISGRFRHQLYLARQAGAPALEYDDEFNQ